MSDDERFERAIESLLADRSPRKAASHLSDEHRRMLRIVQLLRGSRSQEIAPEFVERLYARLFPPHLGITRRGAILSGLGAVAAGLVAGAGIDRAIEPAVSWDAPPLVGAHGRWFPIVSLADLSEGAVRPFVAGSVHGFLVHRHGRLHALSRVCTHMGCLLNVNEKEQTFECPCHGAEFDLHGHLRYGPNKYGQALPPLPPLRTRVRGNSVEVYSV